MRLLIIEDDVRLTESLKTSLSGEFNLEFSGRGEDALALPGLTLADVILLDLGLPDMSGLEICKRIRAREIQTPIIILTANFETEDKVELLDAGADDYLTKPFKLDELKARIRALLRRSMVNIHGPLLRVGDLTLDTASRTVNRGDTGITLRRKEYDLLEFLVWHKGYVMSRSSILNYIWGPDADLWTNAIDVHIKNLRDKIDRGFPEKLIHTIHGVGYKIASRSDATNQSQKGGKNEGTHGEDVN